MPSALWGEPLKDNKGKFIRNPQAPSCDIVSNVPVGLNIAPPPPARGYSGGKVAQELLKYDDVTSSKMPLRNSPDSNTDYVPIFRENTLNAIGKIMADATARRNNIYTVMIQTNIFKGSNGSLHNLEKNTGNLYAASPLQLAKTAVNGRGY